MKRSSKAYFVSAIEIQKTYFFRASEAIFMHRFFDAFGDKRDPCFFGEQFC